MGNKKRNKKAYRFSFGLPELKTVFYLLLAIVLLFTCYSTIQIAGEAVYGVTESIKSVLNSTTDVINHNKFMDSFIEAMNNASRVRIGESLKDISTQTATSLAMVNNNILLIKDMDLGGDELKIKSKATDLINLMHYVVMDTQKVAKSSRDMFRSFYFETDVLLQSFKAGQFKVVVEALSTIQRQIDVVLSQLAAVQYKLTRAYEEAKELTELAASAVTVLSYNAESAHHQVPYSNVALITVTYSLISFVAASAAPFVAPSMVPSALAMATAAYTANSKLHERTEADTHARKLQMDATRIGDFAVSCRAIMNGVHAFNETLMNISDKVIDSAKSTSTMKEKVWTKRHEEFATAVKLARNNFGVIIDDFTTLLNTWYDEPVSQVSGGLVIY